MTNQAVYQPGFDDGAPVGCDMPDGFIRLAEPLLVGIDRQLGYFGDARFVLIACDPWGDAVAWDDGRSHGFGFEGWDTFVDTIVPLAEAYQVELDSDLSLGTHVLLLDRLTHQAYFAQREQAEPFIAQRHQFLAEA